MTRKHRWLIGGNVSAAVLVAFTTVVWGENGPGRGRTEYLDHHRCGVVDMAVLPPRTIAHGDVDGDGDLEHFVANYGGVEQHQIQEGSYPRTMVRTGTVLTSRVADQYSCVDLQLVDLDRDRDLDMVFASHRELVVLTNQRGRFRVSRREPQSLDRSTRPRIIVEGDRVTVEAR